RSGVRQGVLVFVVGAVVIAGTVGIAGLEGALAALRDRLDELGAPTGDSAWGGIALLTFCIAVGGSLIGSVLGAVRGDGGRQRPLAGARDLEAGPEPGPGAGAGAQRRGGAQAREGGEQEGHTEVPREPPPGVERARDGDREGDGGRDAEPASTAAGP